MSPKTQPAQPSYLTSRTEDVERYLETNPAATLAEIAKAVGLSGPSAAQYQVNKIKRRAHLAPAPAVSTSEPLREAVVRLKQYFLSMKQLGDDGLSKAIDDVMSALTVAPTVASASTSANALCDIILGGVAAWEQAGWPMDGGLRGAILAALTQPVNTEPSAEMEEEERLHGLTIDQRDHAQDKADELAGIIEEITGEDIGEHSSANCPWTKAIHAGQDYIRMLKNKTQPSDLQFFDPITQEPVKWNLGETDSAALEASAHLAAGPGVVIVDVRQSSKEQGGWFHAEVREPSPYSNFFMTWPNLYEMWEDMPRAFAALAQESKWELPTDIQVVLHCGWPVCPPTAPAQPDTLIREQAEKRIYEVRMHPSNTDNHPWGFVNITAESPEQAAQEYAENYTREPEFDNVDWDFDIEVKDHGTFNISCNVARSYNVKCKPAAAPGKREGA